MQRWMSSALAALIATAGIVAVSDQADAARKPRGKVRSVVVVDNGAEHPKAAYYHRAPQVRGFLARRGGYSYSYDDTINTYGQSRSLFGGTNTYRAPAIDRQTTAGPFDHGFFYDSGNSPRGGNSPYLH